MVLSETKISSLHGKPYSGGPEVADTDGLGVCLAPVMELEAFFEKLMTKCEIVESHADAAFRKVTR